MVITEGPGTIGTKIISKRYPIKEGLSAATTIQKGIPYLIPNEGDITGQDG